MSFHMSFGILTVSDSSYAVNSKDLSGPKLKEEILKEFPSAEITKIKIVPDDLEAIKSTLLEWCDLKLNVIFTTGGTGFSSRDVTPEATLEVVKKHAPGLSFAMITNSLKITPMAMLSRPVCGIRDSSLIVNLPGSPTAASECFGIVKEALPHAVALLTDQKELVVLAHGAMQTDVGASVVPSDVPADVSAGMTSPSKVKLQVALRDRESPYPMINVENAFSIIESVCSKEKTIEESVPFESSLNRVSAEVIRASEPIPPLKTSMVDGYAVISSDGIGIRVVKQVAAAGDEPIEDVLQPGEAIRISTGAPIPAGADAVVQVEDTSVVEYSVDGDEEVKVEIKRAPKQYKDIRRIGEDVSKNSLVLNQGERIKSLHLGILAMLGKTNIKVYKRPSVGVMSTGNEICEPGEELTPGKIRDANRYTLMNLLKKYHYEANDCGIVKDSPDAIKKALEKSFTHNDVLITSGGVSMGEFDMLKQVLVKDFEAYIYFGRVSMKPGKSTTFATLTYNGKRKIVFGLSGNPVSCGVACLLFVIPALRLLEKTMDFKFPVLKIPASNIKDPYEANVNNDIHPMYDLVKINFKLTITFIRNCELFKFLYANALLKLEPNINYRKSQEIIYAIIFDDFYFY